MDQISIDIATQGFHIVRGFFKTMNIDVEALKQEVRTQRLLDVIFNDSSSSMTMDPCGDQKRKQILFKEGKWSPKTTIIVGNIRASLRDVFPKRTSNDHVFLLSEPGCADQRAHCDWDPDLGQELTDDGVFGGYPLGALLALEPNTALNVWPNSIGFDPHTSYGHERIVFGAGDLLLFRADLIHSGASFGESNLRVHCFMDRRSVKRDENMTYYMDEWENVSAKRCKLNL